MPRKTSSEGAALAELTNRDATGTGTVRLGKAGGAAVFEGMVFAFAGRFSAAQAALKSLVEDGGGSCAASVTLKVTHIITTKAAVEAEKRSTAIATAVGRGLPLLHEDFLARCVEKVWCGYVRMCLVDAIAAALLLTTDNGRARCWICKNLIWPLRQSSQGWLMTSAPPRRRRRSNGV